MAWLLGTPLVPFIGDGEYPEDYPDIIPEPDQEEPLPVNVSEEPDDSGRAYTPTRRVARVEDTCRDEDLVAPSNFVSEGKRFLSDSNYSDAEVMFRQCLDLLKDRCPNHSLCAVAWDNIATICEQTGREPEAREAREHYLLITRRGNR
jgi:hypothetical protein